MTNRPRTSQGPDGRLTEPASLDTGQARWIRLESGVVYSVLHGSQRGSAPRVAVLMVPSFGWDEVETHRARRDWAIRLARAGFPCLRFDLPGTGDSAGGPRDPGLFDVWTHSVAELASWLRVHTGAARVAVIGIGMGGLIATRALSQGAELDDLVLWAVQGSGRVTLREIQAYASIVASRHPADEEHEKPEAGTSVAGYFLAPETQEALRACDVSEMEFPLAQHRRALVLSRDSAPVDAKLVDALRGAGTEVDTVSVRDFSDFTAHPQSLTLRRPESTMALVIDWFGRSPGIDSGSAGTSGAVLGDAARAGSLIERIGDQDDAVSETIVQINAPFLTAPAILCEPPSGMARAPFTVIFLSAGAIRKVGPHRLWVETSRRWAARGVPALRVDVAGVGDARGVGDEGGDERYQVSDVGLTSQATTRGVLEVVEWLQARGMAERIMFVGFCSGAFNAVQVALSHPSVVAVASVNQEAFAYNEDIHQLRMIERITGVLRHGLVRRLREGVSRHQVRQLRAALAYGVRTLLGRRVLPIDRREAGRILLDRLINDRQVDVTLINSRIFQLRDELGLGTHVQPEERWPDLVIAELPSQDHMACVLWLQVMIHDRLDEALARALSRLGPTRRSGLRQSLRSAAADKTSARA